MVDRVAYAVWVVAVLCCCFPQTLAAQAKFFSTPVRSSGNGGKHAAQATILDSEAQRASACSAAGLMYAPTHTSADAGGCTTSAARRLLADEVRISGNSPLMRFSAEGAPTNQRNYQVQDTDGTLYIGPTDDNWAWQGGGHITMDRSLNLGVHRNLTMGGYFKVGATAAPCNATTEGAIKYNPSSQKVEGCDGSNWEPVGAHPVGTLMKITWSTPTSPAAPTPTCNQLAPTHYAYNYSPAQLQAAGWGDEIIATCTLGGTCDPRLSNTTILNQFVGSDVYYIDNVNGHITGCPLDRMPDPFSFTNLTNQPLNQYVESETITLNRFFGHDNVPLGSLNISVSGQGAPQLRVNNGGWVTNSNMHAGSTVQLRMMTAATGDTEQTATVTIGDASVQWKVTTAAPTPCPAIGATYQGGKCAQVGGVGTLLVAPSDYPGQLNWANNDGFNLGYLPWQSMSNGAANTTSLASYTPPPLTMFSVWGAMFPPAVACKISTEGGYNDWYLPARDELASFFSNRHLIGGFATSGVYWSSNEIHPNAYAGNAFAGGIQVFAKQSPGHIRCVRRAN